MFIINKMSQIQLFKTSKQCKIVESTNVCGVFAFVPCNKNKCLYLRTMARSREIIGDPGGVSVCCCGVCFTVMVWRKSCGHDIWLGSRFSDWKSKILLEFFCLKYIMFNLLWAMLYWFCHAAYWASVCFVWSWFSVLYQADRVRVHPMLLYALSDFLLVHVVAAVAASVRPPCNAAPEWKTKLSTIYMSL